MAARLRDVAERAGVSVKTASNVLNHHPHVKASTRERVEAAMAELHYRPNLSARSLKHGRAGFLALAVPAMDSPYFAELAARITEEAAALGFIVLLDVTGGDADAERVVLEGMRSHVIDGVIFSPLALSADEIAVAPTACPWCCSASAPSRQASTTSPSTRSPLPAPRRNTLSHKGVDASPPWVASP